MLCSIGVLRRLRVVQYASGPGLQAWIAPQRISHAAMAKCCVHGRWLHGGMHDAGAPHFT